MARRLIACPLLGLLLAGAVMQTLAQQPSPRLIPFQGRLTDQQGRAYTNGQFSLTFRLYSQAVGGTPIWTEPHRKVGVINGMVNVFLGSITSLDPVEFSQTRHLGITIDADDNQTTADPEMVPRQMIIPAFWAKQAENSGKLAGQDWTPIFGINSPVGSLPASKIQPQGITAGQIALGAIGSSQLGSGAVQSVNLGTGVVQTIHIGDSQITVEKLSPLFALDTVIPPGVVQAFGGDNVPAGWLLCDGKDVSSSQYPRLYSAIGTNWGHGVIGSTNNFNLPDFQGYFLRGVSGTTTRDPDRDSRIAIRPGGRVGNSVGSVQGDEVGRHRHRADPPTADGEAGEGSVVSGGDDNRNQPAIFNTDYYNGSETRPRNAYVHYIVKY